MTNQSLEKKVGGLVISREAQLAKAVRQGDTRRAEVLSRKALSADYKNKQLQSEIARLKSSEAPTYLIKEKGTLQDRLRLYKAGNIAEQLISAPYGIGDSAYFVFVDLQKKGIETPHHGLVRELSKAYFIGMSGLGCTRFRELCGYGMFDEKEGHSIAPLVDSTGKERLTGFIYDYLLKSEIDTGLVSFALKHSLDIELPRFGWSDLDKAYVRTKCHEKAPVLSTLKKTQLDKLTSEMEQ